MQHVPGNHDESYPPLISPESPSYARAWREFGKPSDADQAEVVALIARLSEAEQNAARVCSLLLAALGEDPFFTVLRDRAAVHEARREALSKLIARLGGSAPTDAECRDILAGACDAAPHAGSAAEAKRIVKIMRAELKAEYENALRNERLRPEQRAALAALAPPDVKSPVE